MKFKRVCPTGALQPALAEAGLEGFWTPILAPRLGYCDYACNACGPVYPSQAIPALSLPAKRSQVIGVAQVDKERCLPWSQGTPCIICEEMCPVPDKAIVLKEHQQVGEDGVTGMLQAPEVQRERCIGCGICEYRCPLPGEAAIRISVKEEGSF